MCVGGRVCFVCVCMCVYKEEGVVCVYRVCFVCVCVRGWVLCMYVCMYVCVCNNNDIWFIECVCVCVIKKKREKERIFFLTCIYLFSDPRLNEATPSFQSTLHKPASQLVSLKEGVKTLYITLKFNSRYLGMTNI